MLLSLFSLIGDTLGTLAATVFLLRFWMHTMQVRAPVALGRFIFEASDWIVLPLRHLFRVRRYDWASLFCAFVAAMLCVLIQWGLASLFLGANTLSGRGLLTLTTLLLLQWVFYGLMGLLIIDAVLSWVNPDAPIAPFIRALNEPWMRPLRRIIPPLGSVDLSPLVALLILRVAYQLLVSLVSSIG